MKVVHYVNQFFGGIGAEEQAGAPLEVRSGPVGPGRVLEQMLGDNSTVVATLICGDNYAAENLEEVVSQVVAEVQKAGADLFVAGPCFEAGRYGVAAGGVCVGVQAKLDVPVVTGMAKENPGVDLYRSQVYMIDSGANIAQMEDVMAKMALLGAKLVKKEEIGLPSEDGYHARGFLKSAFSTKTAGKRVREMLVAKTTGKPFVSEIPSDPFPEIPLPAAVKDMSKARVALVTDGGLVPKGNPDKFPTGSGTIWGAYSIADKDDLTDQEFEISHMGYFNGPVRQDPDRLVPVDVMREMEKEGTVGKLHEVVYSMTGNGGSITNARRIGREIAQALKDASLDAVILTST